MIRKIFSPNYHPVGSLNPVIVKTVTIRQKSKSSPCKVTSPAGGCAFSSAGFSFLPKELVCGHAPVDGNLIVFLHLDPVNQRRDQHVLRFVAGIFKAAGPGQDLVNLNLMIASMALLSGLDLSTVNRAAEMSSRLSSAS